MSDVSFLEGQTSQVDETELTKLSALVTRLKEKRKAIVEAERLLNDLEKEERVLSREEIPDFLQSKGFTLLKMDDGSVVEIKEKLSAKLPSKDPVKKMMVLKWVIKNQGENIIDNNMIISDPEESIKQYMDTQGIPYELKQDIHHSRFRSFLANKLGLTKGSLPEIEITDIPAEASPFLYKETIIK